MNRVDILSSDENWISNLNCIYNKMRAASENGTYETNCQIPILVFKDVYATNFFTDSFWFSLHLPMVINKSSSILEIGTGTGIISIILAKEGASRIIATDIVSNAVENARLNIIKHHFDNIIEVREGNVYDPIKSTEKFDYIFWAHPFNNSPIPIADPLLRTGFDYNYNSLRNYIKNANKHLNSNGKLLIGTGDSADLETMEEIANDNKYKMNLLLAETVPLEYGKPLPIEYRIYEFNSVS